MGPDRFAIVVEPSLLLTALERRLCCLCYLNQIPSCFWTKRSRLDRLLLSVLKDLYKSQKAEKIRRRSARENREINVQVEP